MVGGLACWTIDKLTHRCREDDNTEVGGQLTLGGVDEKRCGNARSATLIGYFQSHSSPVIQVSAIRLGDVQIATNVKGTVATQTSYIIVPAGRMETIVTAVGATYDVELSSYVVDCQRRKQLPDLVFQFGAFDYNVPSMDYARKLNSSHEKCVLMLSPGSDLPENRLSWTIGNTFHRPYCHIFDRNLQTYRVTCPV
ncbi:Protein ASP-7, partial [Aphelenchoides avenae]